jgi:hypothetical protein
LKEKCGSKIVSVHVSHNKLMDFLNKNFVFSNMTFEELIEKVYQEDKSETRERYYLRSIGVNARKDVSDIFEAFPGTPLSNICINGQRDCSRF